VGHSGPILAVALTPDGAHALTAGSDGTVRCWDTRTGTQTFTLDPGPSNPRRARFEPPAGLDRQAVLGLDVSPRGDLLATASWDGRVRLWRLADGKPAGPPVVNGRFAARFARFAPQGDVVMVGFDTLTLRAYAVADGAPRGMFDGHLAPPIDGVFLPGEPPRFASLDAYPMLQLWDLTARESLRKYTPETTRWFRPAKEAPFTALAALAPPSGRGATLALAQGSRVLLLSPDAPRSSRPRRLPKVHEGTVRHVAGYGERLASGDDRGRVVLWALRDTHAPGAP